MKWEHVKTLYHGDHLTVAVQTDKDAIQKRIVFVDEDGEISLTLPGFPMLMDLPAGVYTSLDHIIRKQREQAFDEGKKAGQEEVFHIAARLNGADVIADRLTESLGLTYDKKGYKY